MFASCSSDDDGTDGGKQGNGTSMIDEKIVGKWKVEYSKTINPARYDEEKGDVLYPVDAVVTEYLGNYGEPDIIPESGLFNAKEVRIEINNKNSIIVSSVLEKDQAISYKIEDGYLKWIANSDQKVCIKYKLNGNKLIMEMVAFENMVHPNIYTISEYSKITE
ncbi:hypothetical protein D0T57_02460 [Dysgonomonas sp. 511]|nr:hypothetical protein [Dysgonomonas sp. 511]